MNVFDDFSKILRQIEDEGIEYALVDGMAMAFYAEPRFTKDIDILLDQGDFEKIRDILKKADYFESASPWTFKNDPITLHRFLKVQNGYEMIIDVLVAGTDRHKEIIRNASHAESEDGIVRVADKKDLIWLKRLRNSKQDQADIEKLENEKD